MIYNYVTFLNTTTMTVTTEDGGRQNMYAKEPQIEVMDQDYATQAELTNGRLAMLGFNILIINYVLSGNIIPGIF